MEPVSTCPHVWVETLPGEEIPSYNVYIPASQGDGFLAAIHTANPESVPFGSAAIGTVPPDANENVITFLQYQPSARGGRPEEFVIEEVSPRYPFRIRPGYAGEFSRIHRLQ